MTNVKSHVYLLINIYFYLISFDSQLLAMI